jgi:ABC-type nickel/cobalt efflux system permease component RcnA
VCVCVCVCVIVCVCVCVCVSQRRQHDPLYLPHRKVGRRVENEAGGDNETRFGVPDNLKGRRGRLTYFFFVFKGQVLTCPTPCGYTHANTHARTHARTHIHTHTRTNARTHTHTHTHSHTHTHTHTHTQTGWSWMLCSIKRCS